MVAAVSVGIVDGEPLCDLEYVEDSAAETDMNVVMIDDGRMIEVLVRQKVHHLVTKNYALLALQRGVREIFEAQKRRLSNKYIFKATEKSPFLYLKFVIK